MRVYVLANYFGIKSLADYALDRFKAKARTSWGSDEFVSCIRVVYASTAGPQCKMREEVVSITAENLVDLWREPLQNLAREGGDFAVDLMQMSCEGLY